MNFNFSDEQKEIFDFAEHGIQNMIVQAVAGAGKTTTLVECANRIKSDKKVMLLAHNRSTRDTLVEKIGDKKNVKVYTIHGLAYRMFVEHFGFNPNIDDNKYRNYINKNIDEIGSEAYFSLARNSRMIYKSNVFDLLNKARHNLKKSERELKRLAEKKYNMLLIADECAFVNKILEWGFNNTDVVDFQDLLWFPSQYGYFTKIYSSDIIMLDEAQDASIAQQDVISRCFKRETRMFSFGDRDQCQPAGTKVLLTNYEEKNIEDIEVGDRVMTYNESETGVYTYYKKLPKVNKGCMVIGKSERFVDKTFKIYTENGLCSEYSENHICYAKFDRKKCEGKYVVYLMKNECGMWRIGKSKMFKSEKEGFGAKIRMKYEECNEVWVLRVLDSNKDAMMLESFISAKFGIPQIIFNPNRSGNKCKFTKDDVLEYYEKYLGDITDRALKCLSYFNKNINYPFTFKGDKKKYARDHMFKIRACNLIPSVMSVNYFDEKNYSERTKSNKICKFYKCAYSVIKNIEILNEKKKVYSIEVEKRHNYVADGILTHNCINTWCGSDSESFEHLKDTTQFRRESVEFPLTTNYRCGTKIIEYAKRYTDNNIHARENAPEGSVNFDAHINDIKNGDMVLCRNISPLMDFYRIGVAQGKKMCFKGEELGKSLITAIDCSYGNTPKEIIDSLKHRIIATWDFFTEESGLDKKETMTNPIIISLLDNIKTIENFPKTVETREDVEKFINDIFSNEEDGGIQLSTIHRAKGLEADNVFIICPSLIPSKLAEAKWEIEEEKHLQYVMCTRPKNSLNFVSESEIRPKTFFSEKNMLYKELEAIRTEIEKNE